MEKIILNYVQCILILDKKLNKEFNGSIQLHDVEKFRNENASFSIEYKEVPQLSITLKIVQDRVTECSLLDINENLQKIILNELRFV